MLGKERTKVYGNAFKEVYKPEESKALNSWWHKPSIVPDTAICKSSCLSNTFFYIYLNDYQCNVNGNVWGVSFKYKSIKGNFLLLNFLKMKSCFFFLLEVPDIF